MNLSFKSEIGQIEQVKSLPRVDKIMANILRRLSGSFGAAAIHSFSSSSRGRGCGMGNGRGAVSWMKSTFGSSKAKKNARQDSEKSSDHKSTSTKASDISSGKQKSSSGGGNPSKLPRVDNKTAAGDTIDGGEMGSENDESASISQGAENSGRSRLEDLFRRMTESKEVKEQMGNIFKKVRIMVVGRSGSGKSTVIRLVVGDKGPRTMSVGEAGVQDISDEWPYPDPDLPLVFHDSNGIDVVGSSRISDIRSFLDQRQSSDRFSDKVHIVWYVFSAADTRFLDDGGLMEMLDHYPEIPILLIMTCNDHDKMVKKNVEGGGRLDKLLGRISDVDRRDRILEGMIRLGNDVQQEEDGSISGVRDVEGLKRLTVGTRELISKELHATWAACQATSMDDKLSASAKLILGAKRSEIFSTCLLGTLPVAQQTQLGYMLMTVTRSLCKIWGVPDSMQKAMVAEFFMSEAGRGVLKNVLYNVGAAIGLAGTITAAVFTAGAAAAAVASALVVGALSQMKATSALIMSYSLVLLGCILYVKSRVPAGESFDRSRTVDEYAGECRKFAESEEVGQIKSFVAEVRSAWDSARTRKQAEKLKGKLVEFFDGLYKTRPNSFFTALQEDDSGSDGEDAGDSEGEFNTGRLLDDDPERFMPKKKIPSTKPPPSIIESFKYFDISLSDDDDDDDEDLCIFRQGFASSFGDAR